MGSKRVVLAVRALPWYEQVLVNGEPMVREVVVGDAAVVTVTHPDVLGFDMAEEIMWSLKDRIADEVECERFKAETFTVAHQAVTGRSLVRDGIESDPKFGARRRQSLAWTGRESSKVRWSGVRRDMDRLKAETGHYWAGDVAERAWRRSLARNVSKRREVK